MVITLLEEIRKLDEKALLSYWIQGEYEEAEIYRKLAERAEYLGLEKEVVETFRRLGEESKGHGDDLYKIYREKYGDELVEVNIPSIEGSHALGSFWKINDLEDVLEQAMASEKLAEAVYLKLADETRDPKLKKAFLHLASVERGHYNALKALYEWRKKKGLL